MSADTSSEKTDTKTSTDSGSDSGSSSTSSTKKDTAPARPTSYFSSVSTNEYRAGWEGIFGKAKSKRGAKATSKSAAKPRPKKNGKTASAKAKPELSVKINVGHAELDADLKKLLEATVRQHAKTGKTKLAKALKSNKVQWNLECRVID